MTEKQKVCKDCKLEWEELQPEATGVYGMGPTKPMPVRPAPHKGPRCVTHHRAVIKARKARIAESRNVNVYGLSDGDYERLYQFQGGKCAICQRATGKTKRLAVDHSHISGLTRGLLCGNCNRLVGIARDKTDFFERAVKYLRFPPAEQMGIRAIHQDLRGDDFDNS